jgi:hypothetical protein
MPDDKLSYEQATELHARVSSEAAALNRRARRHRIVATVVILTAGLASFSAYLGISSNGSRDPNGANQHPGFYGVIRPNVSDSANENRANGISRGPWKPQITAFGDSSAKAISLAEAKAQAAFPVLVPNADAVSSTVPDLTTGAPASEPATDNGTPPDNSARVVWLDHIGTFANGATRDMVAIEYNHLEIREEQMELNYDGPKSYRDLVDQKADPNAYVGTVQGSAAYIVPPNNDQGTAHPGGVTFMSGNVQIRVEGYYPAEDLISIAKSLG